MPQINFRDRRWEANFRRPVLIVRAAAAAFLLPLLLVGAMVAAVLALLALYVRLVTRHPQALRRGVAGAEAEGERDRESLRLRLCKIGGP